MSGRQSESRNRPDRSPPPLPRAPDSTAPLHDGSTPEWWESPQFLVPVAFVVLALLGLFLWLFLATFSRQTSALGTGNETAATDSTEQSAEEESVVLGHPEHETNPTTDSVKTEESAAVESESKSQTAETVDQGGANTDQGGANTARPRGKAFSISRTTGGFRELSGLFRVDPSVKSIVYVLDKSSSMEGPPINSVKAELIHAIHALNEDQQFGVIFFNSSAWPTMARQGQIVTGLQSDGRFSLVWATNRNKKAMERWIRGVAAEGGTDPIPAMSLAIDATPEMIMLLSDGEFAPSAVNLITRKNRDGGKTPGIIDCVGLAERIQTLQEIAAKNNGRYYAATLGP